MLRRVFCKLLLVAIVIFSLLALTSAVMAQGRSADAFGRVKEVQEKHTERLMAIKGVVGTAVGLDQDNRAVVKVFTTRGGVAGIPKALDGVRVQPVVTGEFYALIPPSGKPDKPGKPPKDPDPDPEPPIDPTARFDRPVPIGVSTGHFAITAGTIGCRVTGGENVYALSNNHVYADENNAVIGDNVLQPGPFDGGVNQGNVIGTLYDFEKIMFLEEYPFSTNTIDAAIALCPENTLDNATPSDGYGIPKSTTVAPAIRMKVKKYGRTTGLTSGKIAFINATVNVGYGSGTARFVDQIIISPGIFSAGGDSGSLIVTQRGNNPVGLLFAGSSQYTIANPIDAVLDELEVTIDGE